MDAAVRFFLDHRYFISKVVDVALVADVACCCFAFLRALANDLARGLLAERAGFKIN